MLGKWVDKRQDKPAGMGTLTHYCAPLRRFHYFAKTIRIDPCKPPFDVEEMIFFIASEVIRNCSVQSLTTWEGSILWLHRLLNSDNDSWRQHQRYKVFRKTIKKEFERPPTQQFPIMIEHLWRYSRTHDLRISNISNLSFNMIALWTTVLWLYLTISRPSEILRESYRSANLYGLTLADIALMELVRGEPKCYRVVVDKFKNQSFRLQQKVIYIRTTDCGTAKCDKCDRFDLTKWFSGYRHIRKKRALRLPPGKVRQRLDVSNTANAAFVLDNGELIRPKHIDEIVKAIAQTSNIRNLKPYTPYSLRVGGTTHAARVGICHSKILQYVGWSVGSLPNMLHRYTTYPPRILQYFAQEMVHRPIQHSFFGDTSSFDPWQRQQITKQRARRKTKI